jgi:hypothetical protein
MIEQLGCGAAVDKDFFAVDKGRDAMRDQIAAEIAIVEDAREVRLFFSAATAAPGDCTGSRPRSSGNGRGHRRGRRVNHRATDRAVIEARQGHAAW